jgi:hypothetical protein
MRAPLGHTQQVAAAVVEQVAAASPGLSHLETIGQQQRVQVFKADLPWTLFDLSPPFLSRADFRAPERVIPYTIAFVKRNTV